MTFWGEADVLFQHARVEPANAANDAKRHVKSRNGGDGDAFEPADARYGGGQSPNGANVTKSPVPSGSPLRILLPPLHSNDSLAIQSMMNPSTLRAVGQAQQQVLLVFAVAIPLV